MDEKTLQKAMEFTAAEEGKRLKLYRCTAGKLTIGIGHNIEDNGISEAACELIFAEDMQEVVTDLRRIFPDFDGLPGNIQIVLCDMRFQLGANRFRGFKNMIAAVKAGNWLEMSKQMQDSNWYKQVPNRAARCLTLVRTVTNKES